MTLNGVVVFILRFSPNLVVLLANYVTAVDDRLRLIMSVNIVSQFQSSTFRLLAITNPPCSAVTLR